MNRRGFLGTLLTTSIAAAFDPERLLWLPGKTIFIPNPVTEFRTPIIPNPVMEGRMEYSSSDIVGWTINNIPKGNFGCIQMPGRNDRLDGGRPLSTKAKWFRYIRAKSDLKRNRLVLDSDVEWLDDPILELDNHRV